MRHYLAYSRSHLPKLRRFFSQRTRQFDQHSELKHCDTKSFLKYVQSTSLDITTTYYKGTLYEYAVCDGLRKFNIFNTRCGGCNDQGVDLRGKWYLEDSGDHGEQRILPVIVQCKADAKSIGPRYVRELEGTLSIESPGTVGILAAHSSFSERSLRTASSSELPMILARVQSLECGFNEPVVTSFIWNKATQLLLGSKYSVLCSIPRSASSTPQRIKFAYEGRAVKKKSLVW